MRIGLVRHFKVKQDFPKKRLVSTNELREWFRTYDTAEIDIKEVDLKGVSWKNCFSSDLPRAIKTAKNIFKGNIIINEALRELEPHIFIKRNIKLPFLLWAVLIRIRAFVPNSHKTSLQKQMATTLDGIFSECNDDILIVSHGFIMLFLRKELLRRGFNGPKFKSAANGFVYIFEK